MIERLVSFSWLPVLIAPGAAMAQVQIPAPRAQVVNECRVRIGDIQFGLYSADAPADAITALEVECAPGTPVTITFRFENSTDRGEHVMQYAGGKPLVLHYLIYLDTKRQRPIISNSEIMAMAYARFANTSERLEIPILASVPAGQAVPVGSYEDRMWIELRW